MVSSDPLPLCSDYFTSIDFFVFLDHHPESELGMMGLHARAMLAIMVKNSMPTWGLVQKLQHI